MQIRAAAEDPEMITYTVLMSACGKIERLPQRWVTWSLGVTNDELVESPPSKFAQENIVNSACKSVCSYNDNAQKVHPMPELFDGM